MAWYWWVIAWLMCGVVAGALGGISDMLCWGVWRPKRLLWWNAAGPGNEGMVAVMILLLGPVGLVMTVGLLVQCLARWIRTGSPKGG